MCMENVKPWPADVEKPEYGWKVFRRLFMGIVPCYGQNDPYTPGEWYAAGTHPEHKMPIGYEPGFHVFFSKEDAEAYAKTTEFTNVCVLHVAVRDLQYVGDTVMLTWGDPPPIKKADWKTFTAGAMKIDDLSVP